MSVPKEIYTIPSSSPVYNVTYVTQTSNPDGTVTSNYTAGYLGTFILGAATGAILADGSGYWWPPYSGGGYYYPYPATYCGAYWGYGYHPYATPYYDYRSCLQSIHRDVRSRSISLDTLRQQNCRAGIQSVHGHLCADQTRFQSECSMGQLLRVTRKSKRYHGPLLDG